MHAFRTAAVAVVVAAASTPRLSAAAPEPAKPPAPACQYAIVKTPFLKQLKPLPRAPFSDLDDVTFAGQTLLALFSDEKNDRWHLVAWDGLTKKPRVLITQKGMGYGPLSTAPDGHRVALIAGDHKGRSIRVYDLATGALSTVASEKYAEHQIPDGPIWDPTGKYLAVSLQGFVEATILPRQVRVYDVQSRKPIRDTPPELDVEAERWDRDGLLLRRTTYKDTSTHDDPVYAYAFSRLAAIDGEPKELPSGPIRSPDGRIDIERVKSGVQIRTGDSACLLELDTGPSDLRPTDVMWLSRDRLLLSDNDGTSWMVDAGARRAQRLAAPEVGTLRFDGRNLVVQRRNGAFATAPID